VSRYPAGTLNLERIQDALYDWVRDISLGVIDGEDQILWRNQSQPLPARPCVTLKIIDGPRPIARQGNLFFNPDTHTKRNAFSVGMQMEMTVSIQVFGTTKLNKKPMALQLALDLNSSLLRQSILDNLKASGVSVQVVGQPRNLTALEESEYEERAGFDLTLGLAQNMNDEPGTIETVNLEVNTDVQDRTKDITLP